MINIELSSIPDSEQDERTLRALLDEFGAIVHDAAENPTASSENILREHLQPLAQRLNLTLGN
jgi:hypothetical protein